MDHQWAGELGSALDTACEKGVLPNPGLAAQKAWELNRASPQSYILALGARLIDLGYLRDTLRNRSRSVMDPYLANSVRKFQMDAGLKPDRYAGPRTWKALDQLVSFENDQEPKHWMVRSGPALARAVYLRLYVLGFFDWKAPPGLKTELDLSANPVFFKALDDFLKTAFKLGLTRNRLRPDLSLDVLTPLFAQDRLIRALARHPEFVSRPDSQRFIESLARIELWLAGMEITPGRPGVRLKKRKTQKISRSLTPLAKALSLFWKHQPRKDRPKRAVRERVSMEFFVCLARMEEGGDDPSLDKELVKQVCNLPLARKKELMGQVKDLATSIWDGFKRVVRWMMQGIKNLFSGFGTSLKNLARFIAQKANQMFGPVRIAVEAVSHGVFFFRNRIYPLSHPSHRMIRHDRDFDMALWDNGAGDPARQRAIMEALKKDSAGFCSGCRILGHLVAIFREVVSRLALGAASWFAVLLTLTRLGYHLSAISEEVKTIESINIDPALSPFSNPLT